MKKLFAFLLAALLVVSMTACGGSTTPDNEEKPAENVLQVEFPGGKISGPFAAGMPFSEGRAFVRTKDSDKVYCITKEGDIVFALTGNCGQKSGLLYQGYEPKSCILQTVSFQYVNGLAPICDGTSNANAFVDMEGKLTKASDLNVTWFGCAALRDGYILAYVEVATGEYKLGIMNTSFEWVVEPTAELYASVGTITDYDTYNFHYSAEGFLYVKENLWLNLQTGEVAENTSINVPSYYWNWHYGTKDYVGVNNEVIRSLKYISNADNLYYAGPYRNGKAAVVFSNGSAGYSFYYINELYGEQFSQKSISVSKSVDYVSFDGNYLLVVDTKNVYGAGQQALCYDGDGKYCCKVSMPDDIKGNLWAVGDGVISVRCELRSESSTVEYRYYDVTGQQLFVG